MSSRTANERKFGTWETTATGGRIYSRLIAGRSGWSAAYRKEVDDKENTVRFGRKYSMNPADCGKSTRNSRLIAAIGRFN
jgi:hypothetical protein